MRLAPAPAVATLLLAWAGALHAQAPTVGPTLRYGSGLLDVPVASVVPHLTVRATYSGFWTDLDRTPLLDASGDVVGYGSGRSAYHDDGSVSVGLFDRGEVGLSLQSLGDAASGGNMVGLFGRLNVFQPRGQGIGFAVGGRYVTRTEFSDGIVRASGRLGFPDPRLVRRFEGSDKAMWTRRGFPRTISPCPWDGAEGCAGEARGPSSTATVRTVGFSGPPPIGAWAPARFSRSWRSTMASTSTSEPSSRLEELGWACTRSA